MADLVHRVDKPEGWTSHDVVARLRTVLGERRVGHAGTLDPFATGLLLVAEGRATSLLGPISLLPKRYRARAKLGVVTDTQDRTGVILRSTDRIPGRDEVARALPRFLGTQLQRPPLYSAVKVRGERLYKAARRGETVEPEARTVTVYDITLADVSGADVELDVTVSRGTYVRTLAHDLGEALGAGAHLTSLRRVSVGPYAVEGASSPEGQSPGAAVSLRARALGPADAVSFLPSVRLLPEEADRLRHGHAPVVEESRVTPPAVTWPLPPLETAWPLALEAPDGSLLAIARMPDASAAPTRVTLLRVLVGGEGG
jgi:tRNA pseudouridine55 synthase